MRRTTKVILGGYMLTALIGGTVAWAADKPHKAAPTQSRNISMEEAMQRVQSRNGDEVVEAELSREDGRGIWEMKVRDRNLKVHKIYLDAQTGGPIAGEHEDD